MTIVAMLLPVIGTVGLIVYHWQRRLLINNRNRSAPAHSDMSSCASSIVWTPSQH